MYAKSGPVSPLKTASVKEDPTQAGTKYRRAGSKGQEHIYNEPTCAALKVCMIKRVSSKPKR